MKEPRCIAQLLRRESPNPINFTITHGRGRKGIIIRTRKRLMTDIDVDTFVAVAAAPVKQLA
ncbi:hypothetical protein ACUCGV_004184 [Escherichia coli]